jgi:hypothetical protein
MAGQSMGVVPFFTKHPSERTPRVNSHLAACPPPDVGHLAVGCHLAACPPLDVGGVLCYLLLYKLRVVAPGRPL